MRALDQVNHRQNYKFSDIITIITLFCDVYTHISLIVVAV